MCARNFAPWESGAHDGHGRSRSPRRRWMIETTVTTSRGSTKHTAQRRLSEPARNAIRRSVAGRGTIESMNRLEDQALVDDLRRRGDHLVRAASLSCTVEQYRASARKVGRKHGWRIRTFLVDGGAGIIVVWVDRGQTELEKRAAMITISTGRNYDEILEELRRQTSGPSRMRERENVAALVEPPGEAIAQALPASWPLTFLLLDSRATRGSAPQARPDSSGREAEGELGGQRPSGMRPQRHPHPARQAPPACCGLSPGWERRTPIRGTHGAQVPVEHRFPPVPAGHSRRAPTERFRWSGPFAPCTPDGIRTRATALRGRRARPLHNGGPSRRDSNVRVTGEPNRRTRWGTRTRT